MAGSLVAVVKAGIAADKVIKNKIPGGYKTAIAMILVVVIFVPLILVNVIMSAITIDGSDSEVCMPDSVVESGFEIDEDHIKSGQTSPSPNLDNSGLRPAEDEKVEFPESGSSTITVPTKGFLQPTYGPRTPMRIGNMWTNPFHDGTDIGAYSGAPILAMADGVISMANNHTGKTAEGSMIEIRHVINGEKYTTAYRHVIGKSIKVKVGDTVKSGQQIAAMGEEGYARGVHLHFVVAKGSYHRYNSAKSAAGTIDPVAFLKSNGAKTGSGGLEGDDFSGGTDASPDGVACTVDGAQEGLGGDGTTAWGQYKNGKFDEHDDLMEVNGIKLHNLAAAEFKQLMDAYKKETKKDLPIKNGYISFDEQKKLYDDEKQIEKAGQSIYGWARAVQFDIKDFSAAEYKWLSSNAAKHGWAQPEAYKKGGSSPSAGVWAFLGGNSSHPAPSNATAAENQAMGKRLMEEKYPEWNSNEFSCLVKLWNGESNWNHKAANPTTPARGIAQTMMSLHFTNWRTNPEAIAFVNSPELQINWGLKYIKGKYKTPCGALAFWNSESPHWY